MDGLSKSASNWMRYVNCAMSESEQNVRAIQFHGEIFYQTCFEIEEDTELLVWYGEDYAVELGLLPSFKHLSLNTSKYLFKETVNKLFTSYLMGLEQLRM